MGKLLLSTSPNGLEERTGEGVDRRMLRNIPRRPAGCCSKARASGLGILKLLENSCVFGASVPKGASRREGECGLLIWGDPEGSCVERPTAAEDAEAQPPGDIGGGRGGRPIGGEAGTPSGCDAIDGRPGEHVWQGGLGGEKTSSEPGHGDNGWPCWGDETPSMPRLGDGDLAGRTPPALDGGRGADGGLGADVGRGGRPVCGDSHEPHCTGCACVISCILGEGDLPPRGALRGRVMAAIAETAGAISLKSWNSNHLGGTSENLGNVHSDICLENTC